MENPGRIETNVSSLDADLLDIEREINGFRNVLLTVKPKFVLSVEAPWGTGKSTFLRILESELKDHSVIKINAWESDYSNDPIAAILSSIAKSDLYQDNKELVNDIFKVGVKFIKKLLPIIVGIATQGIISKKGFENLDFHDLTKEVTSTMIEEFKEQENDLIELRKKLEALVDESKTDKIYFLVDELDRCRPTYAVEFLESIKHLFNVDGIVFVLAVESKVLKDQMKQIYGAEFKSDEYLKKFIDIRYELKPRLNLKFIQTRFEEFGLNELLKEKKYFVPMKNNNVMTAQYCYLIFCFGIVYEFSPRDINQIITKFLIVLSREDWDQTSPLITLFLLVLQHNSNSTLEYFMSAPKPEHIFRIPDEKVNYKAFRTMLNKSFEEKIGENYYEYLRQVLGRIINTKAKSLQNYDQNNIKSIFEYRLTMNSHNLTSVLTKEKELFTTVFNTFSKTDGELLKRSYEQVKFLD